LESIYRQDLFFFIHDCSAQHFYLVFQGSLLLPSFGGKNEESLVDVHPCFALCMSYVIWKKVYKYLLTVIVFLINFWLKFYYFLWSEKPTENNIIIFYYFCG
jgi:hypothetical protein